MGLSAKNEGASKGLRKLSIHLWIARHMHVVGNPKKAQWKRKNRDLKLAELCTSNLSGGLKPYRLKEFEPNLCPSHSLTTEL